MIRNVSYVGCNGEIVEYDVVEGDWMSREEIEKFCKEEEEMMMEDENKEEVMMCSIDVEMLRLIRDGKYDEVMFDELGLFENDEVI
jgi:hypothetical protein